MRRALTLFVVAVSLTVALPIAASASTPAHPAAGIVSAKSDPSTHAAEALLALVPAGYRETCYRRQPSSLADGQYANAVTAVQCDSPATGVNAVIYIQYDNATKLAAQYAASVPAGTPASDGSDTNACNGTNNWHYSDATTDSGSSACFTDSTSATMVWTATASNVLGIAPGTDGGALKQWWNTQAGPIEKADKVTTFGTGTHKQYVAWTKSLLSTRPSLTKCKAKLDLVSPGDPEWAWYPWMQAAEACTGPQGAAVYLAKLDPAAVPAYEAYFTKNTIIGDNTPTTPAACASQDILANKKDVVGKLTCVYSGKTLYATWYATDTGVVGAAHMNTTPKKLFAYLNKQNLL